MLFIAHSPGSRLPASRGRADFGPLWVERRKQTRMAHDSSPGWAVFSRFELLGSCQALFWELNSAGLRARPRQERSASCSAPDQTSARMSAGTAKVPRNLSPPLPLGWVSVNKQGGNLLVSWKKGFLRNSGGQYRFSCAGIWPFFVRNFAEEKLAYLIYKTGSIQPNSHPKSLKARKE